MTLLKSGRLPEERMGTVIELVSKRGNAEELRYLLDQTLVPNGFPDTLHLQTLSNLLEATSTRKIRPAGDLQVLGQLIDPQHPTENTDRQIAAVRLAGQWQVDSLSNQIAQLASNPQTPPDLRQASIDALVDLQGEIARRTLENLARAQHSQATRYQAVAALVAFDVDQAAKLAASVLASGTPQDDPSVTLDAFFGRQQGAEKLADALESAEISTDVAKLALRYMYSVGRSDARLSEVLSKHAGLSENPAPPTKQEMAQLSIKAIQEGDPARGEAVFRSRDVSCMKCHAVSKAGGNVGPDLSAVGASSPPDYLVASIMVPSEAVKEQYRTLIVLTVDGKVYTGIPVDRNENRLILRDAQGKERVIPTADIDVEQEGDSLMPAGLTRFLTHQELLDLVRFLSELGKPGGPYSIRSTATIQRWRVLRQIPPDLAQMTPDEELIERMILEAPEGAWFPAYARVNGNLPLEELVAETDSRLLFLRGEVDVTRPGTLDFSIDALEGVNLWVGSRHWQPGENSAMPVEEGRHQITVRVDTAQRNAADLRVELVKPQGSMAEFTVVDGP